MIKSRLMKSRTMSIINRNLLLSIASIVVLLFTMTEHVLLSMLVVFGQAHFFIAYYYAWLAKKINKSYFVRFALVSLVVLVAATYVYLHPPLIPVWICFSLVVFSFHYALDEMKILDLSNFGSRYIYAAAIGVLFLSVSLFKLTLVTNNLVQVGLIIVSIVLLIIFLSINRFKINTIFGSESARSFVFFIAATYFFVAASYLFAQISIYHISSAIILFHYVRWYLFYGSKFHKENKGYFDYYIEIFTWMHIFVFILYVQYKLAPQAGIVQFLFIPVYFYAWSIIHIIMSIRKNDYV